MVILLIIAIKSNDKPKIAFYHHGFDPAPEAGKSRGLDLILDAHTDLVTASSVTEPFQVLSVEKFSTIHYMFFLS